MVIWHCWDTNGLGKGNAKGGGSQIFWFLISTSLLLNTPLSLSSLSLCSFFKMFSVLTWERGVNSDLMSSPAFCLSRAQIHRAQSIPSVNKKTNETLPYLCLFSMTWRILTMYNLKGTLGHWCHQDRWVLQPQSWVPELFLAVLPRCSWSGHPEVAGSLHLRDFSAGSVFSKQSKS